MSSKVLAAKIAAGLVNTSTSDKNSKLPQQLSPKLKKVVSTSIQIDTGKLHSANTHQLHTKQQCSAVLRVPTSAMSSIACSRYIY